MRFLLDENVDARLKQDLKAQGHDVLRVGSDFQAGLPDIAVLTIAQRQSRVLITNDRDFGELVFRQREPHQGVILLRLGTYAPLELIVERMQYVLSRHADTWISLWS
jgi:predicted nuclease of predicted toxin-antitoxin system